MNTSNSNSSSYKLDNYKLDKMQTGNQTFFLEKLGRDCEPLQYIRELTVNSIQAIQERMKNNTDNYLGQIIWDVDWQFLKHFGTYKLQISDNGTGMTPEHIRERIRDLATSGRTQSYKENFGVGAKITAGVLNPYGLVYKSWVDDKGCLTKFHKDFHLNEYGLERIELENGLYSPFMDISNDEKCNPIDTCGTSITLLGKSEDDTTVISSEKSLKWIVYYLNSKFFEIPNNITIKVRVFNKIDSKEWPQNERDTSASQFRIIKSMKQNLGEHSIASGIEEFETVKIHWFILPEEGVRQDDLWNCRTQSAAIYQGELYEVRSNKQALARIRDFGIIYGTNRMVIYAEPKEQRLDVYPDLSRKSLQIDGGGLPWDIWCADFRQNMPQEIKDMMDGVSSKISGKDHRQKIADRLKEIEHLMRISRYKRNTTGPISAGGHLPGGLLRRSELIQSNTHGGGRNGGGRGLDIYAAYRRSGEPNAIETSFHNNIPDIKWVSIKNGSRFEDDELEDRAAMYLERENTLQINEDFRVFTDLIDHQIPLRPDVDSLETKDVIQEYIASQLVEVVMGIQSLKGSRVWNDDEIKQALSPEALTSASIPRFTLIRQVNKVIGQRRGSAPSNDVANTDES